MRLYNIINAILKEKQIKVFVDNYTSIKMGTGISFYIDNDNFNNFLHNTLAIDGNVQDYFAENSLEIIIDGIYCFLIYNNEMITYEQATPA
jgi:hypothetical protein